MHFIIYFCLLEYLYWLFLTEVLLWVLYANLKNVKKTSGSNCRDLWNYTKAATSKLIWGCKRCPRNLDFIVRFHYILFNQLILFLIFNTIFQSVRNTSGMNTWWISSGKRQLFMISKLVNKNRPSKFSCESTNTNLGKKSRKIKSLRWCM